MISLYLNIIIIQCLLERFWSFRGESLVEIVEDSM